MHVEVESGSGEREEARHEQRRLMASIREGDVVLVTRQDRWSRDTIHFLRSADEIRSRGARFVSLSEGFDPSTDEGRFAATMMAAVAEQERRRIRARTVGARQRLRAQGLWVEGPPPPGYRVEARRLVVDEERAEHVRRMFALYLEGYSCSEVAMWLAEDGLEIDRANVARRLRDRRYLGEMPVRGARFRGARGAPGTEWIASHAPIIDRATWDEVQRQLEIRRVGGRPLASEARNAGFLLRGLGRCLECDHRIVAHAPEPSASVRHGGWYVCRHASCDGIGCQRHDRVDADICDAALERLGGLAERLGRVGRGKARPTSPRAGYEAQRAKLAAARGRVVDAIAAGVLSLDQARGKLASIDAELAAVAEREARDVAALPLPADLSAAALREVDAIRRAWSGLDVPERREIVRILAGDVRVGRDASARRWARGAHVVEVAWRELGVPARPSCPPRRIGEVRWSALPLVLCGLAA